MSKAKREYIYGLNPAFEVIRAGRRNVRTAFINRLIAKQTRIRKLIGLLERNEIPIEWVDKGRLSDLSERREHQGVVLKTTPYPYVSSESLLKYNKLLLLDNVEDPHNVGAILRSAEIFGFHNILLSLKGVPEIYPSIVKVSAGATEFLQIAKDQSANGYVQRAIEEQFTVIALDGGGKTDIYQLSGHRFEKLLLVIGGEDKSVGQFILNKADHVVRIGQKGKINSLNASVAAGISMFVLSDTIQNQEIHVKS